MSDFTFTIGADPELFLFDKNNKAVSAHGLVQGTKEEPFLVKDGAIQVDGTALEFNIDPTPLAYGNVNEFNRKIVSVMKTLKDTVTEKDKTLKFNLPSTQDYDPEYIKTIPETALELGCNPDMNAYTLEENPRPEGEAVNFRTASGHIHIGWGSDIPVDNADHIRICADFVKMMDMTVGLYMTIIDPDQRRRQLYGKAGAFRPKPYGVEYRTPSNVWLTDKSRRRTIFGLCSMAVNLMKMGRPMDYWCKKADEVEGIINNGDFFRAYKALKGMYYSGAFDYSNDNSCFTFIGTEYNKRALKNASA